MLLGQFKSFLINYNWRQSFDCIFSMPFFIRKRGRTVVNQKSKVRGRNKALPDASRKPKLSKAEDVELSDEGSDEEIPSDEENVGRSSDSDSELERETAQEKRLRIAKEYLSQVEAEIDEAADSEDDTDGLLSRHLQHDARKLKGKHFVPVAEHILEPKPEDITLLKGHQLSLTCVVISPDNLFIYTGSKDCSVIKWDVQTQKKVHTAHGGRKSTVLIHKGHTTHILSMAISSSGKFLVTGDQAAQIIVWNPQSMEILRTFSGHKAAVTLIA
ncbi:RRP9 [Bugula neritina]|uniref:RRP9 n=1 Tax=Bugula neritina TaxID=10212 RepID=A0A7J7JU37_BUGNE|nr:RRP9 [Bugula neritina]